MKIIKVKNDWIGSITLAEEIVKRNIQEGDCFGISWKIKKKRKLRRFKLISFFFVPEFPDEPATVIMTLKQGFNSHINLDDILNFSLEFEPSQTIRD